MPYEYHAEVLGDATIRQGDDLRGLAYGAVALVAALLLLQVGVGRWRRAWLALVSLPLSVAGGLLTALITGGAWSVASLTGLFAVLALAIRASVLLGRRVLTAEGAAEGDARKAIRVAAGERAVPLAQTVVATAAFIAPAVVAGTLPGLEFLHPLAVTMLGGLVSLVIVQMLVLPAFLVLVTPRSREAVLTAASVPGPPGPMLTAADGQPPVTRS
jgi:Cu/Ag efflux pump CusA